MTGATPNLTPCRYLSDAPLESMLNGTGCDYSMRRMVMMAMADAQRHDGLTASKPWRIARAATFICLTLGLPLFLLIARHYTRHYAYVVSNGRSVTIEAARDDPVTVGMTFGESVEGLWASDDGLAVHLNGTGEVLRVVDPVPTSWTGAIPVETTSDSEARASGALTVPSSIGGAEERTLSGRLRGTITYPARLRGAIFAVETLTVDVPVEIHLVPSSGRSWSSGRTLLIVVGSLVVLSATALLVDLIRRTVVAGRARKRSVEHRGTPPRRLWQVAWIIGGWVAALVIAFGVLAATGAGAPAFPPLMSVIWVVAGVAAVNALLAAIHVSQLPATPPAGPERT